MKYGLLFLQLGQTPVDEADRQMKNLLEMFEVTAVLMYFLVQANGRDQFSEQELFPLVWLVEVVSPCFCQLSISLI